jgi:DEAD/DEAH box helicase domain-containing protein
MENLAFDFAGTGGGPLVLDVETQYLSEEVPGGWTAVEQFLVALVVTWDQQNGMRIWYEEDVPRLFQETKKFSPIVTFNGEGFDFKVLRRYGKEEIDSLYQKSTDMLAHLSKQLGFRVKLDSVAKATLGRGKTGSGTESVDWWRRGERQKVIEYCKMDVELTRDVYLFGRERGYVMIWDAKQNAQRRVEVSW